MSASYEFRRRRNARSVPDPFPDGPDPLALIVEPEEPRPELYQRVYDASRGAPVTRFAGHLARRAINLLEFIVGGGDAGFVVSTEYGERESFAVIRLRDWASIERGAAKREASQ